MINKPGLVFTASLPADAVPILTTPPASRKQIYIAILFSFGMIALGCVCTPFADMPMIAVPGFMTAFGSGMLVINALLAALLLSKGAIEQRADVVRLGAAYLFVAVIFVPLTLSFKDGFVPGVMFGTAASSVWLWSAWHAGFGLAIGWYALRARSRAGCASVRTVALSIFAVTLALAVWATAGVNLLPPLLWNGRTFFSGDLNVIPATLIGINALALALCLTLRARTTEQLWVTVAMVAACFDLWLTVHGGNRFALGWYLSKCGSLITSFVVLATLFHDIAELYRNSARANRILTDLVSRDGLTGVRNRRFFDEHLETLWFSALASRAPLSVLMVDVDLFKPFNDQYGHVVGDDSLRAVAHALADNAREPEAFVCRYGGEEFVVLAPNASAERAAELAERLRSAIEAMAIPHKHNGGGLLTISIGVATRIPDGENTFQSLLRKADLALYAAKHGGRNRVSMSETPAKRAADKAFEKRFAS